MMISGLIQTTLWSAGKYGIGEDWDNSSLDSFGFSDSASTIRGGGAALQQQELTALTELRRYFFKGYLEITPDSLESIQQYTMMYESAFGIYTGGVYVKRWKTSADRECLQEFLFKFTQITKFKMEPVWDKDDADFADILIRSVQFYGDLGELSIAGCRLTSSHVEDLMDSVPNPEKLKILDIRNNNLTLEVLPKVREKFTKLIDLKTELYEEEAKRQQQAEEEQQRLQRQLLLQQQQREAETKAAAEREKIKQQEERRKQQELEKQRQLQQEEEKKQQQQQKLAEERRQKELDEAARQQQLTISRPMSRPIPEIARGHEEIYRLFYNGKLVYTDPNNSSRKIELPIAALANPLEGEFDLSDCGDTGRYLSIRTGYRKGKIASNKDKVEIWFVPRFMVEDDLRKGGSFSSSPAKHLKPIMDKWPADEAPIGIFWTGGNWDDLGWYDYLTNKSPRDLSSEDMRTLFDSRWVARRPWPCSWAGCRDGRTFHAVS